LHRFPAQPGIIRFRQVHVLVRESARRVTDDERGFPHRHRFVRKTKKIPLVGTTLLGAHARQATGIQAAAGGRPDEALRLAGGQDDIETAPWLKQAAYAVEQVVEPERGVGMPCHGSGRGRRGEGIHEKRRVADHQVVPVVPSRNEFLKGCMVNPDAAGPWRPGCVLAGLNKGVAVDFDGVDGGPVETLGQHQGDEPRAGTNV